MGQGTVLRPTRPGTIESIIRLAGTSSTAYPQGTQSGPPVHLAVPENPCSFRPLRKRSPRFFCHRQREGFFPPCAGKALRHPEGLPSGCFGDQALDRCLFFDYNDIKYGADRLLLNQQILWDREPSPVPCMGAEVMMNGWIIFAIKEKQP